MTKSFEEIVAALTGYSETPTADTRVFWRFYNGKPMLEQVDDFIRRRRQNEPVSKIIGKRGFWTLDLTVNGDVLDPRPDSETLIEAVLKTYPDRTQPYRILDIGTGSGCLLLALLSEYPNATGLGVDKSPAALAVACQNGQGAQAEFQVADFTNADFLTDVEPFDIIISNPPYIPTADIAGLDADVRLYDPLLALDGGADGLDAYRALSGRLKRLMKPGGTVFFEIGWGQETDVAPLMEQQGFTFAGHFKDLGGIVRILSFK